jgi:hypothetical protein
MRLESVPGVRGGAVIAQAEIRLRQVMQHDARIVWVEPLRQRKRLERAWAELLKVNPDFSLASSQNVRPRLPNSLWRAA